MKYLLKYRLIYFAVFITLNACKTTERSVLFQNLKGDTSIKNLRFVELERKIAKFDILSISISSMSPEASAIYNYSSSPTAANNIVQPAYTVDKEGNIFILQVGKVQAEGLTKAELKKNIEKLLLPFLKEPLVTVKFLNQKVTVIGEVLHPVVIPVANEKISLIDALALSGEVLPTGRKDNVLLIHTSDSVRIFTRINLSNTSIFSSPNFYLTADDIVYVEPKKVKRILSPEVAQLIGLTLSTLSLIIVIIRGFK